VLRLPAVRKLLARQLVARVDSDGWDADERQRRSERAGMADLVRRAEQAAFDRLLQPVRIRPRRKPSKPYKRRANMWPPEWTERLKQHWAEGATCPEIAAELRVTPGAVGAKVRREGLKPRYRPRSERRHDPVELPSR
jgi:hypothetical protein